MKIIFLHMTMGLTNRGSEISTSLLASSLARKHEVLVIQSGRTVAPNYPVKRIFPLDEAPPSAPSTLVDKLLFRVSLDYRSRQVCKFTNLARVVIQKFNPDIVVAVNGAVQLRILRRHFQSTKLVVFGRAGIGHDDLANLRAVPDLFIALSPHALTWASSHKRSATQVTYIPNPVDLSLFRVKKAVLNLPRPILMTVGALTSYKNIDKVVAAARDLGSSLLLIGDGEDRDSIADILSSYQGQFRWIRQLDPSELPPYYLAADAFCFVPGSQEAFGRVYLEAMAAGLPIVASDDPIRRKILGPQSIYTNPSSHAKLTEAIKTALLVRKKLDYTKELQEYKLENVIKKIEEEFCELVT